MEEHEPPPKEVMIGSYLYDLENQSLTLNDGKKVLTKKEAQILNLLYKYKNQVTGQFHGKNTILPQENAAIKQLLLSSPKNNKKVG